MMPTSVRNLPKSVKNDAKWWPGALQKRPWKQVGEMAATRLRKGYPFSAIRAILGAILGRAGRQVGPKIKHFGIKTRQNVKK